MDLNAKFKSSVCLKTGEGHLSCLSLVFPSPMNEPVQHLSDLWPPTCSLCLVEETVLKTNICSNNSQTRVKVGLYHVQLCHECAEPRPSASSVFDEMRNSSSNQRSDYCGDNSFISDQHIKGFKANVHSGKTTAWALEEAYVAPSKLHQSCVSLLMWGLAPVIHSPWGHKKGFRQNKNTSSANKQNFGQESGDEHWTVHAEKLFTNIWILAGPRRKRKAHVNERVTANMWLVLLLLYGNVSLTEPHEGQTDRYRPSPGRRIFLLTVPTYKNSLWTDKKCGAGPEKKDVCEGQDRKKLLSHDTCWGKMVGQEQSASVLRVVT